MIDPTSFVARLARAMGVGAAVTAVAMVAHMIGHGVVPSVVALAPAAGLVGAVAFAMSGRRWSFGILTLGVGVAQVGVHGLSSYLTGHAHLSLTMVLAHLIATLGSAAFLAYADRLWWRLWQWATRSIAALTAVAPRPEIRVTRFDTTGLVLPLGPRLAVVAPRGPPYVD
ncbi:hypothetical protein [Aeromicrobium sp. PE09-221]|uniref:hypothetical protein n=1 Tax=Aeromicrobium sp. PE09-221 TaxID=1898043 RepID=UPI00111D02A4|nr:hypothetical protein [Aeromicrobium sp. PE09-221]